MAFDKAAFARHIPKLARRRAVRRAIVEYFGDDAPAVFTALRKGPRLDTDTREDLIEVVLNAFREAARIVVGVGYDGNMPGASGAAWVQEWAGIYIVTGSDVPPDGPFESFWEAVSSDALCMGAATVQVDSSVLPEDQLLGVAESVVDWENEGSVWVNGVEFRVVGSELRRQDEDEPTG